MARSAFERKYFDSSFSPGPTVTTSRIPSVLGTGGGPGGADYFGSMVSKYNQAYGQAKAANEQRYNQMMSMYNQDWARKNLLFQKSLDTQSQMTGQQEADISRRWDEIAKQQVAGLGRLGLATSAGAAFETGAEREKQAELRRLRDSLTQQRTGTIERWANQDRQPQLAAMERREDEYPDLASLQNLLVGYGSYSGNQKDLMSSLQALSNIRVA